MNSKVKILFIGDIVGRPAREVVKRVLEELKSGDESDIDFVIANVENASHGFGLTEKNHDELASYGVDCFTSGNHIWDKKDIFSYIEKSDRLIRPANYPKGTPGVGYRVFEVCGVKLAVINLLGRTFMGAIDSPWAFIEDNIEKIKSESDIIIVDYHAEATAEKICFGKFCAEKGIQAVVGTHTHVQTADEKIINGSTAYISDVGACAAYDSVIGMAYESSLKRLVSGLPERFDVAQDESVQFNAVKITFDGQSAKPESIERFNLVKNMNEDNI